MKESKPKVTVKRINLGYKPRPLQQFLHENIRRFNVIVCHRRFGKTVFTLRHMVSDSLDNVLLNPQYAYIAPTYKQAKRVAWQYLVDFTRGIPNVRVNKTELTIYVDRPHRICPITKLPHPDVIKIMLIGADEPDDIRGIYLDGVILDEFASMDPEMWSKVARPALSDRKKIAIEEYSIQREPWAIFIGTPLGQNHFYRRYLQSKHYEEYAREFTSKHNIVTELQEWKEFEVKHKILSDEDLSERELKKILSGISRPMVEAYSDWRKFKTSVNWFTTIQRASETGILDQEELDEMRADMSEEEIEQELECNFSAAIKGSYFGHLIVNARNEGRVTKVLHNPTYPVDTHWDLGISDSLSIWFRQKIQGVYYYIDYYETSGKGIPDLKIVLDAMAGAVGTRVMLPGGEYMNGKGYTFSRHVWPHDGAARDFSTGVSRQETARKIGLHVEIQAKLAVADRIDAIRNRLKVSVFDEILCERGLECLYNYMKDWDSKLQIFKNSPKHDWTSHGVDAFGYSALDDRDSKMTRAGWKGESEGLKFASCEYNEFLGG